MAVFEDLIALITQYSTPFASDAHVALDAIQTALLDDSLSRNLKPSLAKDVIFA